MAWFDEFNLPGATIDGYFGFINADGPDDDDYPDVALADGTVTFTATTEAARIDGAWLGIEPVTAQIFEGQIVISEEDPRPVRLLATDAPIGVADWAWKASFNVPGFRLNELTFRAPRNTTVNLTADLIPIKSQPYQIIEGASIVDAEVDGMGKMRFEMSDGTYTQWVDIPNGEQGIQGVPGEKGDPGKDGTAANLTMGTVTAGTTADAWMTGTATDRQLNLALPRGQKGDRGEPGLTGPSGIASITSPDGGVWMIDQATDTDADGLEDLQQAVYDKVARWELEDVANDVEALTGTVAEKADSASLSAVVSRLSDVERITESVWLPAPNIRDDMEAAGHGSAPQIMRQGTWRYLRGRFSRVDGEPYSATNKYYLMDLDDDDRPASTQGGMGQVTVLGYARVEISVGGNVQVWPSNSTDWVGVDGVYWTVD